MGSGEGAFQFQEDTLTDENTGKKYKDNITPDEIRGPYKYAVGVHYFCYSNLNTWRLGVMNNYGTNDAFHPMYYGNWFNYAIGGSDKFAKQYCPRDEEKKKWWQIW